MKWEGRRKSSNVNKQGSAGGGRGGMSLGGLGGGGLLLLVVFSLLMGQNPLDLIGLGGGVAPSQNVQEYQPRNEQEAENVEFLSVVLADTEDVWHEIFRQHNATYREPKLTIYNDTVNTACGFAQNNMGPFYCGRDETVYIDVSFANDLRTKFGAAGDFPFAYVLAHEIGHHVQKLTGVLENVQSRRGRVSDVEYNNLNVKLELQADYYAGVFAHHVKSKGYLDPGDIEEGLAAASGVGDDRIMEQAGMEANPDNFTHGSSQQRSEWFMRGVQYGDLEHGNTFELVD